MAYRTKTYIAGDWTGDQVLISKLYQWNDSEHWALHFADAHELTQARDSSLPCSIKRSLVERLDASKTFVLVVGRQTNSLTKGGCQNCGSYNGRYHSCTRGHGVDFRSFVQFECEKAIRDGIRIVVIYNSAFIQKEKCPAILRNMGTHVRGYYRGPDGKQYWNYCEIKNAIMGN